MTDQPDTEPKKAFLRAVRDDLRFLAHIALIPVVAVSKALAAMFSHLAVEIAKI
jgi:hypothetical protein